MVEWITDSNPIRNIKTVDVKLSEAEIKECVEYGLKMAFKDTSNPCYTNILLEINKAVKQAINKPRINR